MTLRKLAASLPGAPIEVLILDGNPIGGLCAARLKPGATVGVDVKQGVFAAVDGRFGEVIRGPSSDREVKLRWLDDGSESSYTKVGKLTTVVANRSDLLEDYSHIRTLGEALSASRVRTYGLANCNFNPASLATFVESVTWETAAAVDLNISQAVIGDAAGTLVEAISSSSLQYLTIGKGLKLTLGDGCDSNSLDAAQKGIELGGAAVIAWWLRTPAANTLTSVDISGELTACYSMRRLAHDEHGPWSDTLGTFDMHTGNEDISADGADPLMECICTARDSKILNIKHDVGARSL